MTAWRDLFRDLEFWNLGVSHQTNGLVHHVKVLVLTFDLPGPFPGGGSFHNSISSPPIRSHNLYTSPERSKAAPTWTALLGGVLPDANSDQDVSKQACTAFGHDMTASLDKKIGELVPCY